jgi:hypothetical protein
LTACAPRIQADIFAGLPGHVGRLGWSAARLRGWPASGSPGLVHS